MELQPMLAQSGKKTDLERADCIFEPKIDGIRALCEKRDGLRFYNRSGRDVSNRYPEFDFADALMADTCVVDGEIVLYDSEGNPDFAGLMKRHLGTGMILQRDRALRFAVFDILQKDGEDLTALPLIERKAVLTQTVERHPHLELMVYTVDGPRLWSLIEKRAIEGVIAKRAASSYRPGMRSADWKKIKAFETLDAVIVGFTSYRRAVSALALAIHEGGHLRFIGKVGTGFSDEDVRTLHQILEPDRIDGPSLDVPAAYNNVYWVSPEHVCEVRYLEFGSQGMLRNPSFIRLRPDKAPEACRLEAMKE